MSQNAVYQADMPQEPRVANLQCAHVFSHEMTNGLSKLQFTIVFCDVAPTSRRRREQNGWSHNFPRRYFLPFILVLGQNFPKLLYAVAAPKYSGYSYVPQHDDSISLIKIVIIALTALHTVLRTLTITELVKKITRCLYNPEVHRLIHNNPPFVPILNQINSFCKYILIKINVYYYCMFKGLGFKYQPGVTPVFSWFYWHRQARNNTKL
jgi:hypothetical protein